MVTTATDGALYLDGKEMANVPTGANAKLDSVELGVRSLELRYADGHVEQHTATVEKDSTAIVEFTYLWTPPAESGNSEPTKDLFRIVKNGTPEDIQAAIDKGANVNARDEHDMTPLRLAAAYNTNPKVIKVLVDAGADVNTPDYARFTPLMYAASKNQNPDVIIALLDAGADRDAKNGMEKTAFDFAQSNEKLKGTDAYQRLASALQRKPESSVESSTKAVPTNTLVNRSQLPLASIRIDGNFDDWNKIVPAFVSKTASTGKNNLAIDKVYLAVDEKNLYVRFDIKDPTARSFFHPNNFNVDHYSVYGVELRNGANYIQAQVYFDPQGGRWYTLLQRLVVGKWEPIDRTEGNRSMKGSSMEVSFALDLIRKNLGALGAGQYIQVDSFTGYSDNFKWFPGETTETKLLTF